MAFRPTETLVNQKDKHEGERSAAIYLSFAETIVSTKALTERIAADMIVGSSPTQGTTDRSHTGRAATTVTM
jgi:hypothetical protein